MTRDYQCGDAAALAGYLYDECSLDERRAIDAHLAICARCAEEVSELRATRTSLAAWTPPETQLGFQIVSREAVPREAVKEARVLKPARWWQQPMPAWAQVAAAILIFAAGASWGTAWGTASGTLPGTVPGGAAQPTPAAVATTANQAAVVPQTISAQDLAALEARLRREMSTMASMRTAAAPGPVRAASSDELLQRVRTLIAESERRQQTELALRVTQVLRDVDAQRRVDLGRIERTLGVMEGTTGPELRQQREAITYLMNVSQRRPR